MSHSPQPHNTFFSLRMVVSNTKATTEKRLAACRQRRGNSFLHCAWEAAQTQSQGTHVLAADQLKADPTTMKLQQLQQPKTMVLKNYRMWVLRFPSLCFVYFAGLRMMLIYFSDNFSWRIRATEEAHSRHLGLLWEFCHNCKHSGNKIWKVR